MKSLLSSRFFRAVTAELPLRITPGPFEVTPGVLNAAARAFAGHRTEYFRRLIAESRHMLLSAFEIDESADYASVILTGTGTAAMEAMVAATVPTRQPLVLVNGRFGRRLADIARLHNPNTKMVDFGIGEPINIEHVEQALDGAPGIDQLLFCVQDTREGILNPYAELCALARRRGLLVTIDGISAMVAEPIAPAQQGIGMFTASSGKAIRGLPGLGIVCGRRQLLESLDPSACRSYYLNLAQHYRVQQDRSEPRFAPATALFYALHQALVELLDEGVAVRRAIIRRRSDQVRKAALGYGLQPLRPIDQMPGSVTSLLLPSGLSFATFQRAYQERGFLVYSGSSNKPDCFQIGTAGYLTDEVLAEALDVMKGTLFDFTPMQEEIRHAALA